MYTVMLLDDEPWELKGLRHIFPWDKYGFEVEYALGDPVKSRDILLSQQIDVLISDIRMPELDGISLLRYLREQHVDTEIVFISGYAEFEYAQQAIKLGAFDYLLKPIDLEELDPLLEKLRKQLEYKKHVNELALFDSILNKETTFSDLFKCEKDNSCYSVLLSKTAIPDKVLDGRSDIKRLHLAAAPNKHLYLLKVPADSPSITEILREPLNQSLGLSYLSIETNHEENCPSLTELISQAETAFYNEFITGKQELIEYYKLNLLPLNNKTKEFIRLFDAKDLVKIHELLNALPNYFIEHSINVNGVIRFWNTVLLHIVTDPEIIVEYNFLNLQQIFDEFSNMKELCSKLYSIVEAFICGDTDYGTYDSNSRKIYSTMVEYINNHYKSSISLQDVADDSHINFTYACKIFKRYANTTYSKYITDLRLKNACQLLSTTTLTIEEICFQIGYSDYFYFNKVFKKHMGLTPYQYRVTLVKNT